MQTLPAIAAAQMLLGIAEVQMLLDNAAVQMPLDIAARHRSQGGKWEIAAETEFGRRSRRRNRDIAANVGCGGKVFVFATVVHLKGKRTSEGQKSVWET